MYMVDSSEQCGLCSAFPDYYMHVVEPDGVVVHYSKKELDEKELDDVSGVVV